MDIKSMPEVEVFTDGSCLGNPGPGGYGVLIKSDTGIRELSGGELYTTNNRMELSAVIAGLSALEESCKVTLYSDSKYIVDAFQCHWIDAWIRNGWYTSKGPTKNQDLWEEILRLNSKHSVTYKWVKGHAGDVYNERCDKLARSYAFKMYSERSGLCET